MFDRPELSDLVRPYDQSDLTSANHRAPCAQDCWAWPTLTHRIIDGEPNKQAGSRTDEAY